MSRLFTGWVRVSLLRGVRGEGRPDTLERVDTLGPRACRVPAPHPIPRCLKLLSNNIMKKPQTPPQEKTHTYPQFAHLIRAVRDLRGASVGPRLGTVSRPTEAGASQEWASALGAGLWLLPGARNLAGLPCPAPPQPRLLWVQDSSSKF